MHMLVIGNGFDLAHGLPTRYTNFLKYCRDYNENDAVSAIEQLNEEFVSIIKENIWLDYFLASKDLEDEKTWIDFEKEISEVLTDIDDMEQEADFLLHFPELDCLDKSTLINHMHSQLRDFVRAFEIYCLRINEISVESVITTARKEQMEELTRLVDMYANQARSASGYINRKDEFAKYENLRDEARKKYCALSTQIPMIDYLSLSKFDCVLSFNYTKTYERLYGNEQTGYCYIHGKAQSDRNKTNIILGINDELDNGAESSNFTWVKFKKYYQRIIFKTGSEYKGWLNLQQKSNVGMHYVHIVGHSLDRTDYEILYEIFTNPNFKIIVYYYSDKDFEEKVQRVIQLLAYKNKNGRDELIRRVHGPQWSIKFVDQYDEREGLFKRNR